MGPGETMSTYLRDAFHHVERITYYYNHAGTAGYAQARHHYDELSALRMRAYNSKQDQEDAPVIGAMIEKAGQMIDAMLKREKESGS